MRVEEKRRVRVAAVTLFAFGAGLLALGLSGADEDRADAGSATEYLLADEAVASDDPLFLTGSISGLELTGVSEDGSIVGYASDKPVVELCLDLEDVLRRDGWTLDEDSGQGVLSFYRGGQDGLSEDSLLVQCLSVGQGSSLVVKRW